LAFILAKGRKIPRFCSLSRGLENNGPERLKLVGVWKFDPERRKPPGENSWKSNGIIELD